MASSASKVAEIFTAAGEAFSRLGDLTMQLHPLGGGSQTRNRSQMKTAIKKRANQEDTAKKNASNLASQSEPKPKKQKVLQKDNAKHEGVPVNTQASPPPSVMLSDSALKNIDIDVMFNNSEQEPVFPDIQTGLDPLERQIASEILSEM